MANGPRVAPKSPRKRARQTSKNSRRANRRVLQSQKTGARS